ncbi:hypothetical protein [Pontibacillus litoralis]|uniref:Uncharacterized protein n=1 Tax=Pontibacillus litoralis JSM 072002 TaxID=1385512 RepID=A0A0A5G322_9BACI|nr:hypothetical protein [Pontibacillus litoralis]KGX85508.1 hypothetical protein N784_08860 [Pontibacillus litoralis JSM 072002]
MSKDIDQAIFSLVYQNRFKRIIELYKRSFFILFDKVTLIYLIPFVSIGMIFLRSYILEHRTETIYTFFHHAPLLLSSEFAYLLLLAAGLASFISPRYKLTNSDYLLITLPVNMELIFRRNIQREQIKRLIVMVILFSLSTLLFDFFSILTCVLLILTFAIVDLFTGLFQWMAFQKQGRQKLCFIMGYFVLLIIIGVGFILFQSHYLAYYYIIGMGLMFTVTIKWFREELLYSVKWGETISYGEEKTWNRLIVKLITGVGFNFPSKLYITKKNGSKKRVNYQLTSVLSANWEGYLLNNKSITLNILINTIAIFILLSIRFHVYSLSYFLSTLLMFYLLKNIFQEQLTTHKFRVLPWSKRDYIKSFLKSVSWLVGLLLILQFIVLIFISGNGIYQSIFAVIGHGVYSVFFFILLLQNSFLLLESKNNFLKLKQFMLIMSYMGLNFISIYYPVLNVVMIVSIVLMRHFIVRVRE